MKSRLVPFLTLVVLVCLGGLFVQHHYYQTLFARQEQAIALAQSRSDALRKEAATARQADAKRQAAHAALISAQTLAPRYDSLRKITGYEKKTTTRN